MTPCDKKSVVPKSLEERLIGVAGGQGVDIDRGQGGLASRAGEEEQGPPSRARAVVSIPRHGLIRVSSKWPDPGATLRAERGQQQAGPETLHD